LRILYHGGGATVTELRGPFVPDAEWRGVLAAAARLMRARGQHRPAELLEQTPFEWIDATNYFNDEFSALRAVVPLDQYVQLQETPDAGAYETVANVVTEIAPEKPYVRFVVIKLDTESASASPVPRPTPRITSEAVETALADAELLLRARGPASAVDRAHTAVHGFLRAALERGGGAAVPQTAPVTDLYRQLRETHAGLRAAVTGGEESRRIVMALASILDSANSLRNTASGAHPAPSALQPPEALLVIHASRLLIHYLDGKLTQQD